MKTLVYENVNTETGISYAVYRQTMSETKFLVFETDRDGHTKCICEYYSLNNAIEFVRRKCRTN